MPQAAPTARIDRFLSLPVVRVRVVLRGPVLSFDRLLLRRVGDLVAHGHYFSRHANSTRSTQLIVSHSSQISNTRIFSPSAAKYSYLSWSQAAMSSIFTMPAQYHHRRMLVPRQNPGPPVTKIMQDQPNPRRRQQKTNQPVMNPPPKQIHPAVLRINPQQQTSLDVENT